MIATDFNSDDKQCLTFFYHCSLILYVFICQIPGQRCLALHLLASVLDKALYKLCQSRIGYTREGKDKSTDWEAIWAYALGPEPELVLALR